jgi:xylose isomerase
MDIFARALLIANDILEKSPYRKLRKERYASYDNGNGKKFEGGQLTLEELSTLASQGKEPNQISGKQELYENLINQYIR